MHLDTTACRDTYHDVVLATQAMTGASLVSAKQSGSDHGKHSTRLWSRIGASGVATTTAAVQGLRSRLRGDFGDVAGSEAMSKRTRGLERRSTLKLGEFHAAPMDTVEIAALFDEVSASSERAQYGCRMIPGMHIQHNNLRSLLVCLCLPVHLG